MIRRFFDDLEQRIEAGGGDHVRFVDDEDAVARLRGSVERAVPQFAVSSTPPWLCGVEFHHVDRTGTVGGLAPRRSHRLRTVSGWAPFTVERTGQDARGGRLPTNRAVRKTGRRG